jgi:predicted HAD superfamily hydrolase
MKGERVKAKKRKLYLEGFYVNTIVIIRGYMRIWKRMHPLSGKYAYSFQKVCILFRERMHPA